MKTDRRYGFEIELRRIGIEDSQRLTLYDILHLYTAIPGRTPTLLRYISQLPDASAVGTAIYLEDEVAIVLLNDARKHRDPITSRNAEILWQHLYKGQPLEGYSDPIVEDLAPVLRKYFEEE